MPQTDAPKTAARKVASPPPPARRSQAQRRAGTRRKLIRATLGCLQERGYSGTTTTAVATRAKLSQGALFVHFKTKAELVAAAVEELFASLIADFKTALVNVSQAGDPPQRATDAIAALWTVFEQPRLALTYDIYAAARTDRVLAATLTPIAAAHRDNIAAEATALFPGTAQTNPHFFPMVELVIDALQGAALTTHALPGTTNVEPMLAELTAVVAGLVAADVGLSPNSSTQIGTLVPPNNSETP